METGQPRFTDPDHVRETLCTGSCWTSGYTSDTMQIVLTATRHDVAIVLGCKRQNPPPIMVYAPGRSATCPNTGRYVNAPVTFSGH